MSVNAVSGLIRDVVKDQRDLFEGAFIFLYTAYLMALES
jgi:hypothetical protein